MDKIIDEQFVILVIFKNDECIINKLILFYWGKK